jgi:ABC-type phosphate/phosphonate transport system substrate-binding protein
MLNLLHRLILLALLLIPGSGWAEESATQIRIGVVAVNGKDDALRSWGPLVVELQRALPEKSFEIVPLTYEEIDPLLKDGRLNFLLVGPTYYVDLEVRRGVSRLATLVRTTHNGPITSLGAVVAVRADRRDLTQPKDLKGKNLIGTNELTLGGWLAPMREFKRMGMSRGDFKSVTFATTYGEALLGMLEGKADAAFVRTGTIELLVKEGRIAPNEIRVLRFASAPVGYPFEISTPSYPEWAFAKTLQTSDALAKSVALALLSLPSNSPLKKSAGVEGFTVPLDYAPVHDLLRESQIGPYAIPHDDSLIVLVRQHGAWAIGGALALLALSGIVVGMASFNRRLAQSRLQVLKMRDELEHAVVARTKDLEAEVERRRQAEAGQMQDSQRIKESLVKTVKAVALTVEMRDPYMSGHQQRVANLAREIALDMNLAQNLVETIYLAGLVHDIGMIYVPSEITNRPGPLSDLEFEIVKTHPTIGHEIMSTVDLPWPIADIVLNHHRRLDGSGYPGNVDGEIPLEARILGVADVVEAMSAHRPYRPPLGIDKAQAEIEAGKGVKYDADVVESCQRLLQNRGATFWK